MRRRLWTNRAPASDKEGDGAMSKSQEHRAHEDEARALVEAAKTEKEREANAFIERVRRQLAETQEWLEKREVYADPDRSTPSPSELPARLGTRS